MPVKPKAPPTPDTKGARFQAYVTKSAERHPMITLSSVGIVVGICASLGPVVIALSHYYETSSDARSFQTAVYRTLAWGSVASIKTETTVAQNRVNDCRIREEDKAQMSRLEQDTCDQYRRDLLDATTRYNDARKNAADLSKGP